MKQTSGFLALILCVFLSPAIHAEGVAVRTEVRIPAKLRDRLKDLSQSLRMVELTPVADANDKVFCQELTKINDPLVRTQLKAEVGDRLSEVVAFKKDAEGKTVRVVFPILSAADAMMMYQGLLGATRIEIDLKRKKKTVAMTYIIAPN